MASGRQGGAGQAGGEGRTDGTAAGSGSANGSRGASNEQGAIRDPDEWLTGDEPITAAQRSYLHTLATEAGERVNLDQLTKAEAAKKIDELQAKTGRGQTRQ